MFFLILQMITGIILAMFYNANTEVAFGVVLSITMKYIMVDE